VDHTNAWMNSSQPSLEGRSTARYPSDLRTNGVVVGKAIEGLYPIKRIKAKQISKNAGFVAGTCSTVFVRSAVVTMLVRPVHRMMSTMWLSANHRPHKLLGSERIDSRTSRPPLPQRPRPLAGSTSTNCARPHTNRIHDARTTRPRIVGAQRSRPPSPARGVCGHPPFDRRPFADTEADAGDCERHEREPRADIRRPEGPGQDLPEPVRPPWRRHQERYEIRRLAQNQGDSAQGPRLGMTGQYLACGNVLTGTDHL
jgi:hypothetical protein